MRRCGEREREREKETIEMFDIGGKLFCVQLRRERETKECDEERERERGRNVEEERDIEIEKQREIENVQERGKRNRSGRESKETKEERGIYTEVEIDGQKEEGICGGKKVETKQDF